MPSIADTCTRQLIATQRLLRGVTRIHPYSANVQPTNKPVVFLVSLILWFINSAVTEAQEGRIALPLSQEEFEAKCGKKDESQDVELYRVIRPERSITVDDTKGIPPLYVQLNEPSTVQIQWRSAGDLQTRLGPDYNIGSISGKRWCTATLVTQDLLLTAGHCFETWEDRINNTPYRIRADGKTRDYVSPYQLAKLMVVNFNYQLDKESFQPREPTRVPIESLVEYKEKDLDYAIAKLADHDEQGRPLPQLKTAKLAKEIPVAGETISIIQHPNGHLKQIENGSVYQIDDEWLYYADIDTAAASSGSGVRNIFGELLAVHTNGGCDDPQYLTNKGLLISRILRDSKELAKLK
jgi:V8-like Glu-specific endopeptidase